MNSYPIEKLCICNREKRRASKGIRQQVGGTTCLIDTVFVLCYLIPAVYVYVVVFTQARHLLPGSSLLLLSILTSYGRTTVGYQAPGMIHPCKHERLHT